MMVGLQYTECMKILYIKCMHKQLTNKVDTINKYRPHFKYALNVYL